MELLNFGIGSLSLLVLWLVFFTITHATQRKTISERVRRLSRGMTRAQAERLLKLRCLSKRPEERISSQGKLHSYLYGSRRDRVAVYFLNGRLVSATINAHKVV